MSDDSEQQARRINLLCKKEEEGYTVMVGPGWLHPRLVPHFDESFESAPVLLDFEHLDYSLKKSGASCEISESNYGSRELRAEGRSATAVARWLGQAMASGVVKR